MDIQFIVVSILCVGACLYIGNNFINQLYEKGKSTNCDKCQLDNNKPEKSI